MTAQRYVVAGMTCEHCVASVTGEISTVPGVTDVVVDLPTGAVSVIADGPLDNSTVRAAVSEAGYQVD